MHKNKHIIHVITGLHRGGAETVLVTLCTELARMGHKQSVIYFRDGVLRRELEILGIATYQANYLTLFTYLLKLQPDLIHSSLWSTNLLTRIYAQLLKIPLYCALHTVADHSGLLRNTIDRMVPFQPKNYIAVSPAVKDSYTSIIPAHKIIVIENGITQLTQNRLKPLNDSIAHTNVYTIGAVGRFVPVKNFSLLLDAFSVIHKEFPHTRLMLVGHGSLEFQLRKQVKQLGLQEAVTFIINKPAREYYKHFNCFVQPSAHEGFSIALLEAMQSSLPAIVTGHNNNHPIIRHGELGVVIEPNSLNALYNAIKFYILNPESAHMYATGGSGYVHEHFSAQVMAHKYNNLFIER